MRQLVQRLGDLLILLYSVRLDLMQKLPPSEMINQRIARTRPFFILSLGRSGSLFLANLLNQGNTTGPEFIYHEPIRLDFFSYLNVFYSPPSARQYFQSFRKKFIYFLLERNQLERYGEVNSVLRRHVQAIRIEIPSAQIIHLVRDGRDVVRSMMARRTYTFQDPISTFIIPQKGDPYYGNWPEMNRFERLCWYWWSENLALAGQGDRLVRLEDLLIDYQVLKEKILDPLAIELEAKTWQRLVDKPKNITRKHVLPHWSDWQDWQIESFNRICGDLMVRLGY